MNDYLYELLKLPKGTDENLAIKKIMKLDEKKRKVISEKILLSQEGCPPILMAFLRHGNDTLSACALLIKWAMQGMVGHKQLMVN